MRFGYFKNEALIADIQAHDTAVQEKLIEALLLVMFADGIVKLREQAELEKILGAVQWRDDLRYRGDFGGIMARIREATSDDAKAAPIIEGIRNLDHKSHGFIISVCEAMAEADGRTDSLEASVIARLRK